MTSSANPKWTPRVINGGKSNPFASQRTAVEPSQELDRILALPRRSWEQHGDAYVQALTAHLRRPGGTQVLRPIQAAALVELHDNKGLLMQAAVGSGKSLPSLLGFIVTEARRPLLLLPAKLIEKTRREAQRYAQHWYIPQYVRIESYEKLGRMQHVNLLEEAQPDVIIADECHRLRNTNAACTKRVKRYLDAHPNTIFAGLSGTMMKRSILDFAHLAAWALRNRNPTPIPFGDRVTWAQALDVKRDNEQRRAPGALIQLCSPQERLELGRSDLDEGLGIVRRAFKRRVIETPGVVATTDKYIGASLQFENVHLDAVRNEAYHTALYDLRERWVRPDNEPLLDAIELWRHLREVALGFFYRWNPHPPMAWLQARREWAAFVREVLRTNRSNIDSDAMVAKAVREGKYDDFGVGVLDKWEKIQPIYTPKTEAVWLDDKVLEFCVAWLHGQATEVDKGDQGGIVWVEHTEFGHELSRRAKIPYYHRGGLNDAGKPIEAHPPGKPLIASIASNAEGRNLQAWSRNLITSIPQSGAAIEQLVGRTHREGQDADEVVVQFLTAIPEQLASFGRAQRDARGIEDTTGQPQKLLYGDVTITEFDALGIGPKKR